MNDTEAADLENTIYLELKDGRVVIELLPELALNHVKRIKQLSRAGFYDGIVFHRVIEGFMARPVIRQAPVVAGRTSRILRPSCGERHLRGVVSMARSRNPNSANSQFFIVFDDASWLDNQYTVWGRVTSGMEFVDQIKKGHPRSGEVDDPDKIVSMKVAADVE